MMKTIIYLLILFAITPVFAQEKAQWRGENRDGIYNETGLLKKWPESGPKLLWHYDNLGVGHGSASVSKSTVYISGTSEGNGFILALDHSGKKQWQTEYGKEWMESFEGVRSTPLLADNKIYLLSSYGLLVCMDAEKGNILWKVDFLKDYGAQNIRWGITENLLIEGDKIICTPGGKDANLVAVNKNSGKIIWKSKGLGEVSAYCSPQLIKQGGTSIVVTHTASSIIGVNLDNGKLLWSYPWPNQYSIHPNTPLFKDGKLFCSSGYGKGAVMLELSNDASSVKKLWENSSFDNQMGGFVELNGKIYGSAHKGRKWFVLDWNSGAELGASSFAKQGNVIYADGLLYCYSENGNVYLVKPESNGFTEISKVKVPYGEKQHWAHLVIKDKKLYVRHGASLMVYSIASN